MVLTLILSTKYLVGQPGWSTAHPTAPSPRWAGIPSVATALSHRHRAADRKLPISYRLVSEGGERWHPLLAASAELLATRAALSGHGSRFFMGEVSSGDSAAAAAAGAAAVAQGSRPVAGSTYIESADDTEKGCCWASMTRSNGQRACAEREGAGLAGMMWGYRQGHQGTRVKDEREGLK